MLPESRYLDYFKSNESQIRESCELIGDILLIERIQFGEQRTASGLYIAESVKNQLNTLTADKPLFFRVLLPGSGFFNETDNSTIAPNAQAGDIILIGAVSAKMFSSFPNLTGYEPDSIGITRDSDVQMRFKGQGSFESFVLGLDNHVKTKRPANG